MTPDQIDRVFGRGRLKMVTGEHVEVFREAVVPGERRRYTKRFLNTREGDFGQWTEREWRILARLIGHGIACVPEVVQFDRGRQGGMQLVQTYDAGVTVDQWATLLPVTRDGCVHRHVFEDCAHWWALAHHCLLALNVIHPLELVHLDIKGDNICIPYAPANFDPNSSELRLRPVFSQLALIDFAFALISRESLTAPLPLGWQREYDYQSPRLLAALEAGRNGELQLTRELDWRCDMYSLAAMLKRHLPEESLVLQSARAPGWTAERYDAARAFILHIRNCHDGDLPVERPHAALIEQSRARLSEAELALSLERGWTLAREASVSLASASPLTPVTRLAPPVRVVRSGRITAVTVVAPAQSSPATTSVAPVARHAVHPSRARRAPGPAAVAALVAICAVAATVWYLADRVPPVVGEAQALAEPIRDAAHRVADTIRGLIHRGDEAQGTNTVAGRTSDAPTAHKEDSAPSRPSTAQVASVRPATAAPTAVRDAARSEPSGGRTVPTRPAAVFPATPRIVETPAVPSSHAAPDAVASSTAQQRATQMPSSTAPPRKKSSLPATVKQASTPSRPTANPTQGPAAKTPPSSYTAQTRSSTQHKAHASWASLEPPAWLRGGPGPGEPPAVKTHEAHAAPVASPGEAPSTQLAAGSTSAPRTEPAESSPSTAHLAAAGAQLADAASTTSDRQTAPLAVASASPARTPLPGAPIEDRSAALKFAPAPAPPTVEPQLRPAAVDPWPPADFGGLGRRTLLDTVPRVARQTEIEVARVLLMAASAYQPMQDRAVADAARLTRIPDDSGLLARAMAPAEALRLYDQARAAFASRRSVREAFDLELQAFGANPRDPDVTGYLAFLHLKLNPPQAETARQVALVALALRGSQTRSTRMEDWNTFAVASALSGREVDARNAFFVTLAVSGNVERVCLSAMNALASFGERLRGPVEALVYRIRAQGRGYDSPACAWAPAWSALSRLP